MTAINTILQRDRVTIATDTAFYDVGGYVQGFAPKAIVVPHWPGIVAMRGPIFLHALLVAKLGLRFETLDAFADDAEQFLTEFCEEHHDALNSGGFAPGFQVTAAGFSPARGTCRAFVIEAGDVGPLTDSGDAFGFERVDLSTSGLVDVPMNQALILPVPSAEAMEAVGLDPAINIAALDLSGIRRFATDVLRAQRQVCDVLAPGEEPTYAVGGRPVFLSVSRDGTVTTSVGSGWPDKVGERINPSQDLIKARHSGPAPETAGMSREQRRRHERLQRGAAKRSAA